MGKNISRYILGKMLSTQALSWLVYLKFNSHWYSSIDLFGKFGVHSNFDLINLILPLMQTTTES
jgi:hypothetical protein